MIVIQNSNQAVDITDWRRDEEFSEYPEGARDKTLLYCPTPALFAFLRENHRYLFKLSSPRYPEEFWVEVFAYQLGIEMDIPVPPTFVAYDSKKKQSGALIEWFLNPIPLLGNENFIPGGDYCQQYIPNFDRKKGKQHNFETVAQIFTNLNINFLQHKLDWQSYWAKTFLFDALIGNTDRHQDNWGIIVSPSSSTDHSNTKIRISPVFDNGSSMGREIFYNKLEHFKEDNNLEKYVNRGWHHMKWSINDTTPAGHLTMLKKFIHQYPEAQPIILDCLKKLGYNSFKPILDRLIAFNVPVKLTAERANFMLKLLQFRYQYLLRELEN